MSKQFYRDTHRSNGAGIPLPLTTKVCAWSGRIKLLSTYYIGEDAAQSFDELEKIIRELIDAAVAAHSAEQNQNSCSIGKYSTIIWGGDLDPIEERLLIAEARLEAACRAVFAAGTNLI